MAQASSVQQARITAKLDGVALGVFQARGEQEVTAPGGRTRLGGMGKEISLGGKSSTGDMTFTHPMDTQALSQRKWIKGRVGKGWLEVIEQPLNLDEVAEDEPDTWSGRLIGYSDNGRASDGEDASQYTLTLSVEDVG